MRRRALLLAGGALIGGAILPALANTAKTRRVIVVHPGAAEGYQPQLNAFRERLKELGYFEGRDIVIELRDAQNRPERLPALAKEAAQLNPDVIVTAGSAGVAACKNATSSIPIVFASAADPVEQGFIASLQRPGGNVTGVLSPGFREKIVEIAREALPGARRLALLIYEPDRAHKPILEAFERTARRFNFEPIVVRVSGIEGLDQAFGEISERRADVLLVPNLSFLQMNRHEIARRALRARLPLIGTTTLMVESGGLLSYGISVEENWRRAAAFVDRILRGAKPGDLPVDQPELIQLIINRRTAQAIGVNLSPVTMLRAERIID
jgi:putative ABC transport system substrate-binding protein